MNYKICKEPFLLSWTVDSLPVGICFHSACQLISENLCLPALLVNASQIHALRKRPIPGYFLLVPLPLSEFILCLNRAKQYLLLFFFIVFHFCIVIMCLRRVSDSREEYLCEIVFFFQKELYNLTKPGY